MTIQTPIAPHAGLAGVSNPLSGTIGGANQHRHAGAVQANAAPAAAPAISVTLPSFAASLLSALGVTGNGQSTPHR